MWGKAPTGGLLSFPVTSTEQELRTLTHEQDQTPSLEPTRGACLSVGPKDHLQEDCHWVVKMPVSGFHNQNLGLGARQPVFCVMLPCGFVYLEIEDLWYSHGRVANWQRITTRRDKRHSRHVSNLSWEEGWGVRWSELSHRWRWSWVSQWLRQRVTVRLAGEDYQRSRGQTVYIQMVQG